MNETFNKNPRHLNEANEKTDLIKIETNNVIDEQDDLNRKAKAEHIKTLMKEVLCNSLAQASMRMNQKGRGQIRKCILFISIVILNCLALYMLVQSIRNYFDYEVITTSRTIYETPTLFPKVTICNQNMLETEFAWDFISNIDSTWDF